MRSKPTFNLFRKVNVPASMFPLNPVSKIKKTLDCKLNNFCENNQNEFLCMFNIRLQVIIIHAECMLEFVLFDFVNCTLGNNPMRAISTNSEHQALTLRKHPTMITMTTSIYASEDVRSSSWCNRLNVQKCSTNATGKDESSVSVDKLRHRAMHSCFLRKHLPSVIRD